MRLLLINCMILLSLIANAAGEVKNGQYSGVIRTQGNLELMGDRNLVLIKDGTAKVELKSFGLLNPIKLIRGGRELIINTQNESFVFKIPKKLIFTDGTISVHKKTAEQNAHLFIKESVKLLNTIENEKTIDCDYIGMCFSCSPGLDGSTDCGLKFSNQCSGSQKALFSIKQYERSLNIKIYNDSGSAEIQSSSNQDSEAELIKKTTSCG